jgi:hypothetical protein
MRVSYRNFVRIFCVKYYYITKVKSLFDDVMSTSVLITVDVCERMLAFGEMRRREGNSCD